MYVTYVADVAEWSRALDIKTKRLVLLCIKGASSNPVEGRTIYIYIYIYIYYISTYHPSLEKIAGIVRHHWKEIDKSETLAMLFPEPPVVAFR